MKYSKFTLLIAITFLIVGCNRNTPEEDTGNVATPTLSQEQVGNLQQELETKTSRDLPEAAERQALIDVTGGNSSAIATRSISENNLDINILADMPVPEQGRYTVWITEGQPNSEGYNQTKLGNLTANKGGWVLQFSGASELQTQNRVVISREETDDNQIETTIMEGQF